MGLLCLWLITRAWYWAQRFFDTRRRHYGSRGERKAITPAVVHRNTAKPPWMKQEVLRLKALMPQAGCRAVADVFNRRCAYRQTSVGKTFVSDTVRGHQYEIQVLRQKIKHRRPRPIPRNLVWGMDLTGKQDASGNTHSLLGLIEHHSRVCLDLRAIADKASITLLRCLLDVIERFGKPRIIRTDNEAIFTSTLFRLGLWLLGIRHQTIDLHCPWQNGRVERFFGTLKAKLDRWQVNSFEQLNTALVSFRFWYNHVRPHQNLRGRTPAEVWAGHDVWTRWSHAEYWFEEWDGLLTGYYLPP